ncbi:MAG: hypothetical protein WCR99_12800 [Sphaerochaeta sp.]
MSECPSKSEIVENGVPAIKILEAKVFLVIWNPVTGGNLDFFIILAIPSRQIEDPMFLCGALDERKT